ncbi:hypothetical protein EBZ39_09660 [bacterium]|nr:hypothetical protein [bacterium]
MFWFLFGLLIACNTLHGVEQEDSLVVFNLAAEEISSILENTHTIQAPELRGCPPDVSFGVADVKYNRGKLKVVECGSGEYAYFGDHELAINGKSHLITGPYWGLVWHFLKSFGKPIWFVTQEPEFANAFALETLEACGGKVVPTLQALQKDPDFTSLKQRSAQTTPHTMQDAAGIIVFRSTYDKRRNCSAFCKENPSFVVLNAHTRKFFAKKEATYRFFEQAGMGHALPMTKIYTHAFSPDLAENILRSLPKFEHLIIKPTDGSLARGVNIVKRDDLHRLLPDILQQTLSSRTGKRPAGIFPINRHVFASFMASEFFPSQTLLVDGKPWDPTMRVMYVMWHDQGVIRTNVLGCYWKIAGAPLNDPDAPLHAKHITNPIAYGPILPLFQVDPTDQHQLKESLKRILAQVYRTVLKTDDGGENEAQRDQEIYRPNRMRRTRRVK